MFGRKNNSDYLVYACFVFFVPIFCAGCSRLLGVFYSVEQAKQPYQEKQTEKRNLVIWLWVKKGPIGKRNNRPKAVVHVGLYFLTSWSLP